jgi:RNA polymerase sigma factor (sigma-70 family)
LPVAVVAEESLGTKMEDQSLLSRAAPGWSEPAFREIFLEHYGRVKGTLCRLVGDPSQAEELANEVFWRLYHRRIVPGPDGNLNGWLYRTATRLGIDALRAAGRRRQYEHAGASSLAGSINQPDPLEEMLRAEKRRKVRSTLALLRPGRAQLLILRASGFSYKELACILNLKGGSVGTMLIRAENDFRRRYLKLYGKEEAL